MTELYEATIAKTYESDVATALFSELKFPQESHIVSGDSGICKGASTHCAIFHKDTLGEDVLIALTCTAADIYLSNIDGTDKYVFKFSERIPKSERQSLIDRVKKSIEEKGLETIAKQ